MCFPAFAVKAKKRVARRGSGAFKDELRMKDILLFELKNKEDILAPVINGIVNILRLSAQLTYFAMRLICQFDPMEEICNKTAINRINCLEIYSSGRYCELARKTASYPNLSCAGI